MDSIQYNTDVHVFIDHYYEDISSNEWLIKEYPSVSIKDRFFVLVDTILYSEDGCFLFVFYGRGDKWAINDNRKIFDRPTHYECESAIGYRDTLNSCIYFYRNGLTINSDNYRRGMDGIVYYYQNNLKNKNVISPSAKYGKIGYNVNDSLFFEKSLLFKKFNDTLYYFQIDNIIDRKNINKADSIILIKSF